jgi:hypothetical protein
MNEFREILHKKLKEISFSTFFEGHSDYSNDEKADFDYLPLGGLKLLFEDESTYSIADYFSTSLGTEGVGIRKFDEFKRWPDSEIQPKKWSDKIGKEIKSVRLYWNKEDWTNGMMNEFYPDSVELLFDNGPVFYFCGDVDGFNPSLNRYDLLTGRDCGLIFYTVEAFRKYQLDKARRIEELKG